MLNTIVNIDQARYDATADTQRYLRHHGAGLCDLLDDPSGFTALCDLHAAYGQPFPNADAVETALRNIHSVLADLAPSTLDRIGRKRNLPASDMARWHGARVSELLARFIHAS